VASFRRVLQLCVVLCLLCGVLVNLLLHLAVEFSLATWLLSIMFVLFFVNLKQSLFLSCALEDGKELLSQVLLLVLGLRIRISSSLFLGLEPRLRTSKLHPLACRGDLVVCPLRLGLLLVSLLVLVFLILYPLFLLPLCLLRELQAMFKYRYRHNRFIMWI